MEGGLECGSGIRVDAVDEFLGDKRTRIVNARGAGCNEKEKH
jgi:hypothetical protein